MDRSRRLKYSAVTAPLQFVLSVLLALLFAQLGRESSGEWADLIGVIVGIVFGPCLGVAVMVFLVQRARSASVGKSLLVSVSGAVGAFALILIMFGVGIHPFVAIAIVFVLSSLGVWVLSGHD